MVVLRHMPQHGGVYLQNTVVMDRTCGMPGFNSKISLGKIDINLYKINKLVCTNGTDVSSNENVAGK